MPPLGLITVSALLPPDWKKRLVDLNSSHLSTGDLQWANYVFISAMHIQKDSVEMIIRECLNYGVQIVAGGPLFTYESDNYPRVDHFILNEAEITLKPFLKDLANGKKPLKVYKASGYADLAHSPTPDFYLLEKKHMHP